MGNTQSTAAEPLSPGAQEILDAIKAAMQPAEERGVEDEHDYLRLMAAIRDEAQSRYDACATWALPPSKDGALENALTAADETASISLAALLTDEHDGPATLEVLMDNLLVTAIEGGSVYWCAAVRVAKGEEIPVPTEHGEAEGMPWYTVAFQSGTPMRVAEDEEEGGKPAWHDLNRELGIRGLRLLVEGKHCHAGIVASLIREKAGVDAEVADVWLQLAVLGEVRYG